VSARLHRGPDHLLSGWPKATGGRKFASSLSGSSFHVRRVSFRGLLFARNDFARTRTTSCPGYGAEYNCIVARSATTTFEFI
jgi:hypothetical protein